MYKNLCKFIKDLISEQIAVAKMLYFEQVFAFWKLINKKCVGMVFTSNIYRTYSPQI